MGAWSEDIYGSDAALDTLNEIETLLGVEDLLPEAVSDKTLSKARLAANRSDAQTALWQLIGEEDGEEYRRITAQVVCSTLMMLGAEISSELKTAGLASAVDEYENWQNPDARRAALETFRNNLQHYVPGQAISQPSKGLFQRLAELFNGSS